MAFHVALNFPAFDLAAAVHIAFNAFSARHIIPTADVAGNITTTRHIIPAIHFAVDISGSGNIAEAVSALVVLGYSQSEAARAIAGQPAETSVQDLIKTGLKKLAGSR